MKSELEEALADQLLAMGDDELILGHRGSEWGGHAPILEEDIAFANLALDEIGHASLWYGLLAELAGKDPQAYPDELVFRRPVSGFRNTQMVELPNGDWAFSMLRQFLFDAAETVRLEGLSESVYAPLAGRAARVRKEEVYHYRHTHAWIQRLGQSTEESHRRLQNALDELWPFALQLFVPLPGERSLVEAGILPVAEKVRSAWESRVLTLFVECGLAWPETRHSEVRRDQHTLHLKVLVTDMQSVARMDPQAEW